MRLLLLAVAAAAQAPSAAPTYETLPPTRAPSAVPTYRTPAPFAAPPDDYDRTKFDHDPGSCANYGMDEVYTGDALGLGGGLLDEEDCCFVYKYNDCTHNPTGLPTAVPSAVPTALPSVPPSVSGNPSSVPTAPPSGVPTSRPSGFPTRPPSRVPVSDPTAAPTSIPTSPPSEVPSNPPTPFPSEFPTTLPTSAPTSLPTLPPTPVPSAPTAKPSRAPTWSGSRPPTTAAPSRLPSSLPSSVPSALPSSLPTALPSAAVSRPPSSIPSALPTPTPTSAPTAFPSRPPTSTPSPPPTSQPTAVPTTPPSPKPSVPPTSQPTAVPTTPPSPTPTTPPSSTPTSDPSAIPTSPAPSITFTPTAVPSAQPSRSPTTTRYPTSTPTSLPSPAPTTQVPTSLPSTIPSPAPTLRPSLLPTVAPTTGDCLATITDACNCTYVLAEYATTLAPTARVVPTVAPTPRPSTPAPTTPAPTPRPSLTPYPSAVPTGDPTGVPTSPPSPTPTSPPSSDPTRVPTVPPTSTPTSVPSSAFSALPTPAPSRAPTAVPSTEPTPTPSASAAPSALPSSRPTTIPSARPTGVPTTAPTSRPTQPPTSSPSPAPTARCPAHVWLEGDATTTGAVTAVTGSGKEGPDAVTSADGASLRLDGPWEGGVDPASGVDACCRFVQTPCPTPVPTAVPTALPSPAPSVPPTGVPTSPPTGTSPPSTVPVAVPTAVPTSIPTSLPTSLPSTLPTSSPSRYAETPGPTPAPSARPSPAPTPAPTPVPTPAPSGCRCVMDFGFTRGVGGFAYRGDGLLYGALPAVNPAGTKWLAGDDALLDGFAWAEYVASRAFYRSAAVKARSTNATDMDAKCIYRKEPEPSAAPTPRPSVPPGAPQPTAAPTGAQAVVEVQAAVVLTGIDATDFNSDPNQQEAFAQSILAHLPESLAGAEVTDIVAAAARRRRLQASVAVSYTIIVRQDAAAVTDGGVAILDDITTSLSAAVSSGEFLDTLIAEAAAAGASAAIAFQTVSVDEAATLDRLADATVTLVVTTAAPSVATPPEKKKSDAVLLGLSLMTLIVLGAAVVGLILVAVSAFCFVRQDGPAKVAALMLPSGKEKKHRTRRVPLVDFSKLYWPCCPPKKPVDRKAGLVEVPAFGSPYANSVSTHVGYDLVDEYHQRAHAKRNAWTRYENVLLRIVKVQIVEGAYYEKWKDAVAEAEIDDDWPRVVIARSEVRQEILGERRTMVLLGYGDAYTRVLHASDPPPGVKTDKVMRRVETCSVVAVLPPKKSKAAKQKLKLAAKASIDHYTGKIIGEKVLTSKMRETATEPGEDGPTWYERPAPGEFVCWSAACWEPEDGNANMLQLTGKADIQAVVVGPWAGPSFPGKREGPYARETKLKEAEDHFVEDDAPAPVDPKKALDAVSANKDGQKIIRNEQLKKVLNQRTTAFEASQMAIEKKRAERARTPAKVAPAEEET